MNTKEVYINDMLIDLDEVNNPIQLTYAINDLAELKDRQAYSTNSFKIPKTQNNLLICGYPDNPNLIQLQPYRKNTAKIVQNGIEILTNGIALIDAAGKDIQVQVLSGLIGFFDLLGDKKISDLDLSQYDHIWNVANAANSQNNSDGYIYPVIDYGGLSNDKREADVRQLRPATFRKTVIEKIVSEAGYTIVGVPLTYEKYLKSLMPFTNDNFSHGKSYIDYLNTFKVSARKNIDQSIPGSEGESDVPLQDDATTDPSNSWNGNVYTAQVNTRLNITFKYTIEQRRLQPFGTTPENYVSIQKNGVDIAGNLTTNTEGPYINQIFADQQITVTIDAVAGDTFRLHVVQLPGPNRLSSVIKAGAEMSFVPVSDEVTYGSEVQLSATLPDVTQKNFFKDFLQNFGLIVIPDNYRKELRLINMEEVYNNKPNAFDITDRLIDAEENITFSFGNYGINNIGKYKEDDHVDSLVGNGVIVLDNQTLEENVTLFTSIFAATTNVNRLGGLEVAEVKKIEDVTKSSDFTVKTQPRILLDAKLNTQFKFFDGSGSQLVNLIGLPKFNGLDYSLLFDENYPEIKRMLFRPFVVEKSILLKETDIASLDWTIPVYDAKSANYYYKNQIKYIQNGVSTISLIRMG